MGRLDRRRTKTKRCWWGVVIMDVRHPMTDLDRRLIDWYAPTGEADPHPPLQRRTNCRARTNRTLRGFRPDWHPWSGFFGSVVLQPEKRPGIEEAETVLAGWLGLPAPAIKGPGKGDPGQNALTLSKAPAQGKAGDSACHLVKYDGGLGKVPTSLRISHRYY